jgi:hypothetical protein
MTAHFSGLEEVTGGVKLVLLRNRTTYSNVEAMQVLSTCQ